MSGNFTGVEQNAAGMTVLILSDPALPHQGLFKGHGIDSRFGWLYLGKDYSRIGTLEREIGPAGERISIGDSLQEAAKRYRQDYIDFIGALIPVRDRLRWWGSSAAEKNPFVSDLFLYFCYVRIALDIISSTGRDLVIVCESPVIGEVIHAHCRKNGCRAVLQKESPVLRVWRGINHAAIRVGKTGWFAARYSIRIMIARLFRLQQGRLPEGDNPGLKGSVLIHSWADSRSFPGDGQFTNIFFGDFIRDLEEQGRPFHYLVDVLPTLSFLSAVRRLSRHDQKACLLEEFLNLPDVFRAIAFGRIVPQVDPDRCTLGGISMVRLIAHEFEKEMLFTRKEESYLKYLSTGALARDISPSSFVYLFENHVWDKLIIAGFREHSPATTLAGYVHTIVREMHTCYSLSERERTMMPLPDVIVVTGKHARDGLVRSGFHEEMIRIGGALRYPGIRQSQNPAGSEQGLQRKRVLLALSAGQEESRELLLKSVAALDGLDVEIIVKCHPILPCSRVLHPGLAGRGNVTVSEDPVSSLLMKTDLLLYSETTVCIEALASGIPVVNVRSDCRIDMNILKDLTSAGSGLDTVQIRKAVVSGLSRGVLEPGEEERAFIDYLFSPVQPNIVGIFTSPG